MYGNPQQVLEPMVKRFDAEFNLAYSCNLIGWWYPCALTGQRVDENKLTLIARFRYIYMNLSLVRPEEEQKRLEQGNRYWLGVDVLLPGYCHCGGRCFAPMNRPSVSFYQKRGRTLNAENADPFQSDVFGSEAEPLSLNFIAKNREWFDNNGFGDTGFGSPKADKLCYRPTRFWNVAEAGHVTDLIVQFVRMWCRV